MDDAATFQRITSVTALLAGLFAATSLGLLAAAAGFDPRAGLDPIGSYRFLLQGSGPLVRWGMLCDLLGYYLLLTPLALYLHRWLAPKSRQLFALYTLSGLAYILVGAAGAATLAAVLPPLIEQAPQTSGVERMVLDTVMESVARGVVVGLWNTLEVIPASIWWLGVGWHLRPERPALGFITIILGGASLLNVVGVWLGLSLLSVVGLNALLMLVPVWALWLGIVILRRDMPVPVNSV